MSLSPSRRFSRRCHSALVQVVLVCLACEDKRYKNRELQIMKDMVYPDEQSGWIACVACKMSKKLFLSGPPSKTYSSVPLLQPCPN